MHPTEKNDEVRFLNQLGTGIKELEAHASTAGHRVSGIGIGVPSFVHDDGEVDTTYGFLPFMENYPLVKMIEQEYKLPCKIDNDARAVALGEALFGKGQGHKRVLVLTLGTGLGLGFVKDGKLEDKLPFAHMGGHMTVTDNDQRCYCGKTGCLESLVSSAGIRYSGEVFHWTEKYPEIPLTAEALFTFAAAGNRDARAIVDKLVHHLHTGIHNYVNLYAPDILVIGGGIAKGLEPYLESLAVSPYLKPFQQYSLEITISALQEFAGILGSAALVNR
jgi:glucokinase